MEEVKVNTTIMQVNTNVALFSTDDIVSGVIHVHDSGITTIIFDGNYVFGEFHCADLRNQKPTFVNLQLLYCEA